MSALREGAGGFELLLEGGLAERLQVVVAANVLLGDEGVGHAPLARLLLEVVLHVAAVACAQNDMWLAQKTADHVESARTKRRTLFVQLVDGVLGAGAVEGLLGGLAVRAVALAKDHDGIVPDEGLGLLLEGGGHCAGGCS